MDESILPLISDAKTTKEAWDTLERCFGEVKDEGGSVATDLKRDAEFFESHCAQSQVDDVCEESVERDEEFVESHCVQSRVDDVCEESAEAAEREHEDVCEPHYTQLQVDEDLLIPATWIADEDLVIPATELADESLMKPATQLADDDLLIPATQLADDEMVNPAMQLADENLMVDVNFDHEFLTNDD